MSKRQSVTLTARDLADLTLLRHSAEARRAVGVIETMSETAILHALISDGLRRARQAAEEAAYRALADDPEEQEVRLALRGRERRPGLADHR
jgi:hypothetical protein